MKSTFSSTSENTLFFPHKFYLMLGLVFALILLNNLNQALVLEKQFNITEVTAVELDDASDDSQEDVAVCSFEYMLEQNNNFGFIQTHKTTTLHSTQHLYSSRAPPYSLV